MHAFSDVEYLLGRRRSTVTAQVGVDGVLRADSGVVTGTMAAKPVQANVSGADQVRLVVTDGGDGINSDHAD